MEKNKIFGVVEDISDFVSDSWTKSVNEMGKVLTVCVEQIDEHSDNIRDFFEDVEKSVFNFVGNILKDSFDDSKVSPAEFEIIKSNFDYASKDMWCIPLVHNMSGQNILEIDDLKSLDYFKNNGFDDFLSLSFRLNFVVNFRRLMHGDFFSYDRDKLRAGMQRFNEGNYYEAIGYFLKMIDGMSIKRLLAYKSLNKLGDFYSTSVTSYASLFAIHSTLKYNGAISSELDYLAKRAHYERVSVRGTAEQEIINALKLEKEFSFLDYNLLHLLVCNSLLNSLGCLYATARWSDGKPKYFNRNWYSHGMYDVDDVTYQDCVQVMLIFYHLFVFFDVFDPVDVKESV